MLKNNIGKKITEIRKKLGFKTQKDFAQALGMPFRTLQTYEQGTSVIPHTFFENLKNKFDIEIGTFFSEDNEDTHETQGIKHKTAGERFAEALRSLNLTTSDIVEQFGITQQYLSVLRKNDKINSTMADICVSYDIDLNWIVSGKDNIQKALVPNEDKIDKVTLEIINEQYNKALQENKLKELRVYLLNFECDTECAIGISNIDREK